MKALFLAVLLAAPGRAARPAPPVPDAETLLRRSLEPSTAAYEGVMSVTLGVSSKTVSVKWQKPGLYRREVLDAAGAAAQVIVSDGSVERVYDSARRRLWLGEPADPETRRLAPDDELDLLLANYAVTASTDAPVAGRPVWRLELRAKAGGGLRRRLWVDRRNGLVLGSADYRPEGGTAWSARFVSVRFPGRLPKSAFAFAAPEGTTTLRKGGGDYLGLEQAQAAAGRRPLTPAWLPSGYVFESLDVLPRGVLHLRYSDGVNALSLFQCPPKTRLGVKDGASWTAEGRAYAWTRGGARLLLVGALSAEELRRAAESVR